MLIQETLEKLTRELMQEKEIMMKKSTDLGKFLKTKTGQKFKWVGLGDCWRQRGLHSKSEDTS